MNYLSAGDIFKKGGSAVLVGVYTDKITVSSIRSEEGKITIMTTVIEPQEGDAFLGGALDIDRIVLHCRKALAALLHSEGDKPYDVVFALGGGVGAFSFVQEKSIRKEKERKITQEEVAALVGARTQGNNEDVNGAFAESFLIDGFAINDPVGMHGGELLVGVSRMACGSALAKGLASAASDAGLRVKGFFDMRYAAAHHAKLFKEGRESAIVLCVFENETSAILVRNRAVAGVGAASAGYGIMIQAIENAFSVGREEAKKIIRAFTDKTLDMHVSERVREAYGAAQKTLVAEIVKTVSQLDSMSLLPGTILLVVGEDLPQIDETFRSPEWLASLPIERNAAVTAWHAPEHDARTTAFDALTIGFF